jgi:hypothetical protein
MMSIATQMFGEGSRHNVAAGNGQGENIMNSNTRKKQHLIDSAQRKIQNLVNVNNFRKATNSAHPSRKTQTPKNTEDFKLFSSNLKSILSEGNSTVQKFGPT